MNRSKIPLIVGLLIAALGIPALARAQATTAEGVQAIVRGDYEAAVRILRPLAEGSDHPDPLAQFFMAGLYDAGHGVPRDNIRACGLYRNAGTSNNPLRSLSLDLARFFQGRDGNAALARFCDIAAASPSSPFAAASFALASDHSVTIDGEGATVIYKGTEQHVQVRLAAGFVPLPIRHTPVDVSRPVQARRHFIRYFLWVPEPASDPLTWTLGWILWEVVGSDFIHVTGDPVIATIVAPKPPLNIDVDRLARVGVNGDGEAEWTVLGGTNPRSGVIPFKEPR